MITAILLAAGESRRMGRNNKLLLDYKGQPLVKYVSDQLTASDADEYLVVLGYQAPQVKESLGSLDIQFVENKGFYSGMMSSAKAGIKRAHPGSNGFLICLADMPEMKAMHYNALIRKFSLETTTEKTPIVRPVHKDKKGFPILFHNTFKEDILQCKDSDGFKQVLEKNSEHLIEYPLANTAYYIDINTEVEYYKFRK